MSGRSECRRCCGVMCVCVLLMVWARGVATVWCVAAQLRRRRQRSGADGTRVVDTAKPPSPAGESANQRRLAQLGAPCGVNVQAMHPCPVHALLSGRLC